MPVAKILLYPDPTLRMICASANAQKDETRKVIQNLCDTLDAGYGVGIAAPQIGAMLRIIIVDATRAKRPTANHGRLVLLNPQIVVSEGDISFREGCMSLPDLVGQVPRAEKVTIAARDVNGEPLVLSTEGYEAVILQHEIDHLDGVLFIDRVRRARDIKPRSK